MSYKISIVYHKDGDFDEADIREIANWLQEEGDCNLAEAVLGVFPRELQPQRNITFEVEVGFVGNDKEVNYFEAEFIAWLEKQDHVGDVSSIWSD